MDSPPQPGDRDLLFTKPSHPKLAWGPVFRPGWL
ncbi:mCG1031695 [Mus musculus]|nr:mCG1031695 [Mus musculus]